MVAETKKETAVRLYHEGMYIWQIASFLHVTESTVVSWLGL